MIHLYDASVLIPMLVEEVQSEQAERAWQAGENRYCLDLTYTEIGNALWRKQRSGAIPASVAELLIRRMASLPLAVISTPDMAVEATAMGIRLDHPIYDCLYAVAAIQHSATFVTADGIFARKLAGEPVKVILIGGE